MDYSEALAYLDSFINYEKIGSYSAKAKFKLERMERFLEKLGNPQCRFSSIHAAGTKGKGSTCAFLYSMLKASGKRVGLYTSPHLVDFRERIRVGNVVHGPWSMVHGRKTKNESLIGKKDVCELLAEIKPHAEKMRSGPELGELSFFEVYTALAFLYFAKKNVEYAVVETGMGGRLDATNVVDGKLTAITRISHDHTQQLGGDISSIAKEKAGIIKENGEVVCAPQAMAAEAIIKDACRSKGAKLHAVGKDLRYDRVAWGPGGEIFDLSGLKGVYLNLRTRLLGAHQVENAAVAVGVAEILGIDERHVRAGLEMASWPGRLQVIAQKPLVILDGAQNVASARALRAALEEIFPGQKFLLVFGVSSDKDVRGIAKELFPFVDEVILTKADNPRACEPNAMAEQAGDLLSQGWRARESVARALDDAISKANGRAILVAGSLYVVGDALRYFGRHAPPRFAAGHESKETNYREFIL